MDLFKGSVEPANQIHDYNPGNDATGIFWTIPIARENLRLYPEDGTLVMDLQNVALGDYGSVANFFMGKPSIPSTLNLRMEWSGSDIKEIMNVRNLTDNFEGQMRQTSVTVTASASTPSTGFKFTNDPTKTTAEYAAFGMERNGSYFRRPDAGGM